MLLFVCHAPGCQSSCELDPRTPDSDVLIELAKRGWQVITTDKLTQRFCQAHHKRLCAAQETKTPCCPSLETNGPSETPCAPTPASE